MHRYLSLLLLGLVLAASCCSGGAPVPGDPSERASQEADISEAVFRYQFKPDDNGISMWKEDFFFLSVGEDADPAPGLMQRFADHTPPVEPISRAETDGFGVSHKQEGGRGVIFKQTELRWIDGDTVEVSGGYYSSGLSAAGETYRVERKGGKWTVASSVMHWIS